MSEIDKAQFDYYKKFPELIIESGNWQSFIVCERCKGGLKIDFIGFLPLTELPQSDLNKVSCPLCKLSPDWHFMLTPKGKKRFEYGEPLVETTPIPHKVMRRRFHVINRFTPNWWEFWKSRKTTGFWEIEEIKNLA